MRPILFPESATQFNTNGLGRLDCISCVVVEERNGEYTLIMEIAETTLHAKEIQLSMIIVAKPSDGATLQAFRVYKITKPLGGKFTVLAQHISYQLSYIPTMPFDVNAGTNACSTVLSKLKSNAVETCPFNFSTDVHTVASYNQTVPASIRSRLGGVEGSVLDQFGGEYEWNNYNVILHKNRGLTVPNVSLRYGKNIIDLNQETQIENTITGIVPYWQSTDGKTTITLPEKVVNGAHASAFPFKRTIPMDFSQDFQEEPTVVQLRSRAQMYVNASGVGIPAVSIKVSFINLADTEEYKNLASLQTVKLCDNVEVYFEKLGIATTAKIVRTEYDVLLERYNSVEIGSLRNTLSGVISSTEGAIAQVANDTRRLFQNFSSDIDKEITDEITNATKWLTGSNGYVMAVKNTDGTWKELLFVDSNNPAQVHNVLRINENGIGFSSNGINGPYHQGWTLDGRMLIGGTNIPALTVYQTRAEEAQDHKDHNLLFKVSNEGMEWHAVNSDLSKSGTLTIKKTYSDGTVKTIGIWDDNGLVMYDGNGTADANITGKWTTAGLNVFAGTLQGMNIKGGTITGSTIQTKEATTNGQANTRIVMTDDSSIQGMLGNTPKNKINMIQDSSTAHLTIDAGSRLNIRTPELAVNTNPSDSNARLTQTNSRDVVQYVRKYMVGDNIENPGTVSGDITELYVKDVGKTDGDVYCTLPVYLYVQYRTEDRVHGMVVGETVSAYAAGGIVQS